MEKSAAGAHHALAVTLERGFPGMASRMLCHEHKIPRRTIRYPWRRDGPAFPHHESEIAQSRVANGKDSVRYWMHNNMITIDSQKMGKSLGNFITLDEFFSGDHPALTQAYSPMTIRFFILQAHYRSTLDFSNEALQAAEKGAEEAYGGV